MMNALRFDQWTKQVVTSSASRRGLLRFGLGGVLAAMLVGPAAEGAAACRANGKPCDKGRRNGGCCSGTCKKGKCRRTSGAAGCTVEDDLCQGDIRPCPGSPSGYCVKLDNGKPFCATTVVSGCQPCTSHAGCSLYPNGKCLKTCTICSNTGGQACFYPHDTPIEMLTRD